ncbi:MAG: hypothetical protein ACJ796_14480 [Gemmatimonadaceae bacterium]
MAQPSPTVGANDSGAKVRVPNDSAARVAIDAYLKAAAYTAGPMPDSLSTCDEDYSPDNRLALASYQLLAVQDVGDSIKAAAQIVSVARFAPAKHGNRTDVIMGVRVDTLHWTLGPTRTGRWIVCGYSSEGFDLTHFSDDPKFRWSPPGASAQAARRLADSVSAASR